MKSNQFNTVKPKRFEEGSNHSSEQMEGLFGSKSETADSQTSKGGSGRKDNSPSNGETGILNVHVLAQFSPCVCIYENRNINRDRTREKYCYTSMVKAKELARKYRISLSLSVSVSLSLW